MYKLHDIKDYTPKLSVLDTEDAISLTKKEFQRKLAEALNLRRVSAPMLVESNSGVNDDLNGYERAVRFDIKEIDGVYAEIVHSLAKWKRIALGKYGFVAGDGLYTDMNAIRRDDNVDNLHSIYVDQWDWEKVITREERSVFYLAETVRAIVRAIVDTSLLVKEAFPEITVELSRNVFFITSQELEDAFPDLSCKERERAIVKEHKTVFIMQIGDKLKGSNAPHDGRAPDYDDWALNGDLLFWDDVINDSVEISSMGIRVDEKSLLSQLEKSGKTERLKFHYHQDIISGKLPLTIGGGIGQSRLCMLLLQKAHIGEVQVSIWPASMVADCAAMGIKLL